MVYILLIRVIEADTESRRQFNWPESLQDCSVRWCRPSDLCNTELVGNQKLDCALAKSKLHSTASTWPMSWVSSPALFQWFREDYKLKHRMWTTIFWRSARSKNERWSSSIFSAKRVLSLIQNSTLSFSTNNSVDNNSTSLGIRVCRVVWAQVRDMIKQSCAYIYSVLHLLVLQSVANNYKLTTSFFTRLKCSRLHSNENWISASIKFVRSKFPTSARTFVWLRHVNLSYWTRVCRVVEARLAI